MTHEVPKRLLESAISEDLRRVLNSSSLDDADGDHVARLQRRVLMAAGLGAATSLVASGAKASTAVAQTFGAASTVTAVTTAATVTTSATATTLVTSSALAGGKALIIIKLVSAAVIATAVVTQAPKLMPTPLAEAHETHDVQVPRRAQHVGDAPATNVTARAMSVDLAAEPQLEPLVMPKYLQAEAPGKAERGAERITEPRKEAPPAIPSLGARPPQEASATPLSVAPAVGARLLREEAELIGRMRSAIQLAPAETLAMGAEHRARFVAPRFAPERDVLSLTAMVELGMGADACAFGKRMQQSAPNAAYKDKINALLAKLEGCAGQSTAVTP